MLQASFLQDCSTRGILEQFSESLLGRTVEAQGTPGVRRVKWTQQDELKLCYEDRESRSILVPRVSQEMYLISSSPNLFMGSPSTCKSVVHKKNSLQIFGGS